MKIVLAIIVTAVITTVASVGAGGLERNGDVNLDGVVDPTDAALILQMSAGLVGGSVDQIPVPKGLTINHSGCDLLGRCLDDGEVRLRAMYSAATLEIVVDGDSNETLIAHETCHAHQHWVTLDADVELLEWAETEEARGFYEAAEEIRGVYGVPLFTTPAGPLEWFAGMCALWVTEPVTLIQLRRSVYDWFSERW